MPDPVATLTQLDHILDGATLWGVELDVRYRVLATTVELAPDVSPWSQVDADDRRVQLLTSPVSTMVASFRRVEDGQAEVFVFTVDQLIDVAATFGGATLLAPRFGAPEPRPGSWAPQWSLEGRSSAPDGTAATLTLSVRQAEGDARLELDLFARFDEAQVNTPDGETLVTVAGGGGRGLDLGLGI